MHAPLEFATYYAGLGWHIFPLAPGLKTPFAGSKGFKDATTDIDLINQWWARQPAANIGLATGSASGVWVVDIDIKGGKDGFASLREFAGEDGIDAVKSIQSHTASGGRHLFFATDPTRVVKSSANILTGVDVRGDGGYVVLPPSTTPVGAYRWTDSELSLDVTAAPAWAWRLTEHQREKQAALSAGRATEPLPWNLAIITRDRLIALEDIAVGSKVVCRCPFHNDRSPSAFFRRIDHGRGFLHCSSCGKTWRTETKTMSAAEAISINQRLASLRAMREKL